MVLLLLPVFLLIGMYRAFTRSARETRRAARSLESTFLKVLLRDAVVIDSAVWQDDNRRSFFKALAIILAAAGKKVILYDCQYRELTSAAKADIKQFRQQDVITLAPADISPAAEEDAAPPAIRALICAARTSRNVVLVSDDRELIAQARTAMKKSKTGFTAVDSLEDLEAACRNYCAAVDGQKVIPLAGRR
jgi:rRNA-processing protein FCF1